jgi:ribosomal protein S18 acetylase RimI-like enzyme
MPPEELARHLRSEACRIYVLREIASPEVTMGFCEFDLVDRAKTQLMNFGLKPEYFRRGCGLPLLCHALCDVWSVFNPQLIWLHTDSMDHPRALDTYRRAGFEIDRIQMEAVVDL